MRQLRKPKNELEPSCKERIEQLEKQVAELLSIIKIDLEIANNEQEIRRLEGFQRLKEDSFKKVKVDRLKFRIETERARKAKLLQKFLQNPDQYSFLK